MEYDVNKQSKNQYSEICGPCGMGFNTREEYLDHTCGATGHKVTEMEHHIALDPNYAAISEAALKRGNRRAELEADGKTEEEVQQIAHEESVNPPVEETPAEPTVPTDEAEQTEEANPEPATGEAAPESEPES